MLKKNIHINLCTIGETTEYINKLLIPCMTQRQRVSKS